MDYTHLFTHFHDGASVASAFVVVLLNFVLTAKNVVKVDI